MLFNSMLNNFRQAFQCINVAVLHVKCQGSVISQFWSVTFQFQRFLKAFLGFIEFSAL
jgi:hypothetical protein